MNNIDYFIIGYIFATIITLTLIILFIKLLDIINKKLTIKNNNNK